MIEATINAWKQFVSHLKQLIKQYTKPLTTGPVTATPSDTTRSRVDLIAENALPRRQLIGLRRQTKRRQLTRADRIRLVLLARCTQFWRQALHIVQPDTLLHWHRDLFRRHWWHKSRNRRPKPRIASRMVAFIKQMAKESRPGARNALAENC